MSKEFEIKQFTYDPLVHGDSLVASGADVQTSFAELMNLGIQHGLPKELDQYLQTHDVDVATAWDDLTALEEEWADDEEALPTHDIVQALRSDIAVSQRFDSETIKSISLTQQSRPVEAIRKAATLAKWRNDTILQLIEDGLTPTQAIERVHKEESKHVEDLGPTFTTWLEELADFAFPMSPRRPVLRLLSN